jgi:muramidase (phage lysozyme)
MDCGMSDNPLDRIPAHNRVSIRAVLVRAGEDPAPALLAAGITDPIAIPVVLGDDPHAFGMLGDGRTPNLIGVLETNGPHGYDAPPVNRPNRSAPRPDVERPAEPSTTTAPATFGLPSFAPIRRVGDTSSGRFGSGGSVAPPQPAVSMKIDRMLTSGWKKPGPYVRFDPLKYAGPRGVKTKRNLNAASGDTTSQDAAEQPSDGRGVQDGQFPAGSLVVAAADPTGTAEGRNPDSRQPQAAEGLCPSTRFMIAWLRPRLNSQLQTFGRFSGRSPRRKVPRMILSNHTGTFSDYSTHPPMIGIHSPAGAYQIVRKTWKDIGEELGLTDFSPHTQDLIATRILSNKGAISLIESGHAEAVGLAKGTWAALPGSGHQSRVNRMT